MGVSGTPPSDLKAIQSTTLPLPPNLAGTKAQDSIAAMQAKVQEGTAAANAGVAAAASGASASAASAASAITAATTPAALKAPSTSPAPADAAKVQDSIKAAASSASATAANTQAKVAEGAKATASAASASAASVTAAVAGALPPAAAGISNGSITKGPQTPPDGTTAEIKLATKEIKQSVEGTPTKQSPTFFGIKTGPTTASTMPLQPGALGSVPAPGALPSAAATPPGISEIKAADGGPPQTDLGAAVAAAGAPAPSAAAAAAGSPAAASPPVGVVLKEAMKEMRDNSKETVTSLSEVIAAFKNKKPINITLDQVVTALFYLYLAFQLLLIKLFRPSFWWLLVFLPLGVLVGLGMSFAFYYNRKRKAEACEVLGFNIGLKGLQHLLGTLPSWLNYTEREKIQWLNAILEEVWPFYDKGVCKLIKKMTEGVFDQVLKSAKVPGIKKVGFKQLTFGDAPFRIESIFVSNKHKDAMVLEVDVRWVGEANITMAIELSAGEFAKMCPRVTDITFIGSLRITLKPLVDTIPGFGAAVVTFRKPPRLKYRLDFGRALGGQYAANVVKPFINHVIQNVMLNMLVWPQRLVVPIINTEAMQVEIAKLAYRNQGLLKVTVIQATGLKSADMGGKSDPFAELTTDGKLVVATKVIKNTLTPQWGQTFHLLVQEPNSQELQVSVYDKDFFSPTGLLSLNLGQTFGAKELLGRCSIKMAPITVQEPDVVTKWFHLGEGDWSNPEGCGKGAGRIQLSCIYRSLENFKADEIGVAEQGVLMVRVIQANKLPRGAGGRSTMTAFVRIKCGENQALTPPVTSRAEHKFTFRNNFEFYNVKFSADIKFKVFERTSVADDEVGEFELGVSDVASACDHNPLSGRKENGLLLRTFTMDATSGAALVLQLRFAPNF